MKTKININGKDVDIDLTADQVREINKQSLDIKERVKTLQDAIDIVKPGMDVMTLLSISGSDKQIESTVAHAKLSIIAKALNEGWEPDWADDEQYKYWPWLTYSAGVGFSYYVCDYGHSYSGVGSRLCFKSRELAQYAAEQFRDIYNEFFN